MRWARPALWALLWLGGCGDESHHRATTTDETFTSSVGDEDEEDEEEAESRPEGDL